MPPALLRQLTILRRSHPFLRHLSISTVLLILLWLYVIRSGERIAFTDKIARCDWPAWEDWPTDARPHRAVLIADPQLVDAHTYPGRPWPLSSLTEKYTDRYMARSYRMINAQLDPDSVIFLGDMFDGGREWAPEIHKPLTKSQRWYMEAQSPATSNVPKEYSKIEVIDAQWIRTGEEKKGIISTEVVSSDVTKFVPGENGRWHGYDNKYWELEYNRFGKIFLAHNQLYPKSSRQLSAISSYSQEGFNIDNGAPEKTRHEYGSTTGKTRNLLSSLPGNHDLGFGSGVQLAIRARYKWHFGELNRVNVLGNHTFVSIDALSLAAWSQFEANGQETSVHIAKDRKHIYAAGQAFLDTLPDVASPQISDAMSELYPAQEKPQWSHTLTDLAHADVPRTKTKSSAPQLPVVLLTHVPLYREADTDCGSQRERGHALSITGGYQYQNVLTRTLSNTIAQKLGRIGSLSQVFSGDDHDYCRVTHQFKTKSGTSTVREETVKSFSWAMGVRHPGFMMVSLWNPVDESGRSTSSDPTIQSHLCLLPDQLAIFIRYAWLAGLTIVAMLVRAIILSFRNKAEVDDDTPESSSLQLSTLIPSSFHKLKGLAKGYKPVSKGRQRASSSALKPPSDNNLSVQRSSNARARSVSPGVAFGWTPLAPRLEQRSTIDQAGYLAQLETGVSDDEESRVGDADYLHDDDAQAKWRRRRRPKGKIRRAWDDFTGSMMLVAGVVGTYYLLLIRSG